MTQDSFLAIKFWFDTAINFLKSIYLPGTNVTPLAMLLFGSLTYIVLKFVFEIMGLTSLSQVPHSSNVIGNRYSGTGVFKKK